MFATELALVLGLRPSEVEQLVAATDRVSAPSINPPVDVAPPIDSAAPLVDPCASPVVDSERSFDHPSSISSTPSIIELPHRATPRRLDPALDAVALDIDANEMPPKKVSESDRETRHHKPIDYDETKSPETKAKLAAAAKKSRGGATLPKKLTDVEKTLSNWPYQAEPALHLLAADDHPLQALWIDQVRRDNDAAAATPQLPSYDPGFADAALSAEAAILSTLSSQMMYVGVVSQRIMAYPGSASWNWDTVGRVFDDFARAFTPAFHTRVSIVHMASKTPNGAVVLEPMVHEPATSDGQCCLYSCIALDASPADPPAIEPATASDVIWSSPTEKVRAATYRRHLLEIFDSFFEEEKSSDDVTKAGRGMVFRANAIDPNASQDDPQVAAFRLTLEKNVSDLPAEVAVVLGASRQTHVRTPRYMSAAVDLSHFMKYYEAAIENDHLIGLLGAGAGSSHVFDKSPTADTMLDWWTVPTSDMVNSRRAIGSAGHWEPLLPTPELFNCLFNHPNIASDPSRCYPAVYAPHVPIYLVPQFSARVFGSAATTAPVDAQSRYVRPGLIARLVDTTTGSLYSGAGEDGDDRRKRWLVVSTYIELLDVNGLEGIDNPPMSEPLQQQVKVSEANDLNRVPRERVLLLLLPERCRSRQEQSAWLDKLAEPATLESIAALPSADSTLTWNIVDLQEIVPISEMPRSTAADTFPRVHIDRRAGVPTRVDILLPLVLSPGLMSKAAYALDRETRFVQKINFFNAGIEEDATDTATSVPFCLLTRWQARVYAKRSTMENPIDLRLLERLVEQSINEHPDRDRWLNKQITDRLRPTEFVTSSELPPPGSTASATPKKGISKRPGPKKPPGTPTRDTVHREIKTVSDEELENVSEWERPPTPEDDKVVSWLKDWKKASPIAECSSGVDYRSFFSGATKPDHWLHSLWSHMNDLIATSTPSRPSWEMDYLPIRPSGTVFTNPSTVGSVGSSYVAKHDPQAWLVAQLLPIEEARRVLQEPSQSFRSKLPSVQPIRKLRQQSLVLTWPSS